VFDTVVVVFYTTPNAASPIGWQAGCTVAAADRRDEEIIEKRRPRAEHQFRRRE
jgi:hypothetical protein